MPIEWFSDAFSMRFCCLFVCLFVCLSSQFYKTLHEHIGEAIPIGSDGLCSHPYLVPSMDRKQCVLPGRIDIGRHYLKTGGVEGLKENYDDLVSRGLFLPLFILSIQASHFCSSI